MNLYQEGDKTHFGQKLNSFRIEKLWNQTLKNSNYKKKEEDIIKFNSENKFKKRGISIVKLF
jgi:xanthine dehydrogenase/oxidase